MSNQDIWDSLCDASGEDDSLPAATSEARVAEPPMPETTQPTAAALAPAQTRRIRLRPSYWQRRRIRWYRRATVERVLLRGLQVASLLTLSLIAAEILARVDVLDKQFAGIGLFGLLGILVLWFFWPMYSNNGFADTSEEHARLQVQNQAIIAALIAWCERYREIENAAPGPHHADYVECSSEEKRIWTDGNYVLKAVALTAYVKAIRFYHSLLPLSLRPPSSTELLARVEQQERLAKETRNDPHFEEE